VSQQSFDLQAHIAHIALYRAKCFAIENLQNGIMAKSFESALRMWERASA
jgi:hypothetical protein